MLERLIHFLYSYFFGRRLPRTLLIILELITLKFIRDRQVKKKGKTGNTGKGRVASKKNSFSLERLAK